MIIEGIVKYDGKLLHNRFAYKYFKERTLPIGNIIAFRGPMEVEAEGMIDTEDILKQDYIYSDDAMNFLWEIPMLDSFGAVAYQRLLNVQMANILSPLIGAPIEMKGDDMIVHKVHEQGGVSQMTGKCSVSITYSKNNVALGHTGINIRAGRRAPAFAYSTNLNDDQAKQYMQNVINTFYSLNDDIFIATTKAIC